MASFCNKCGAPVSGIFCVKCGYDTRQAGSPPPQPATPQAPPAALSSAPPAVSASSGAPAAKFCNKCGTPSIGTPFCNKCGADLRQAAAPPLQSAIPAAQAQPAPLSAPPPQPPIPSQTVGGPQSQGKGSPLTKILVGFAVVVITVGALAAGGVYYVVYRVKQKVHEVARDVPGLGRVRKTTPAPVAGSWAPSRKWFPVPATAVPATVIPTAASAEIPAAC